MSTAIQFDDATSRNLDVMYRSADAAARRAAVLDAVQLQSGERVLDIGAGPGFLAAEMADAVTANGQVHCVDMSDRMLQLARARCADRPWVSIQPGTAMDLPAGESLFHAAISVQVFEYVADIEKALSEIYRVLRPGGRAAIVSTDWDAIAWHASDGARMSRVLAAFEEHCAHTSLPRALAPALRKTGFVLKHQRVVSQFNLTYDAERFSYHLARMIASFVPRRRGVTQEEAVAWMEDLQQTADRGEYFFCLNQYLHMAEKPA